MGARKIRNPKSEIRKKSEDRNPNCECAIWCSFGPRASDFGFRSRYSAKSGVGQKQFKSKQAACCQQRPLEQRAIGRETAQLHLSFFQPIDIVINVLQLSTICRSVKLGIR